METTNYHLTQFLSGHGCFGQYLRRIGRLGTPECHHCRAPVDDADHAFFHYDRWRRQRRELVANKGNAFNPETTVKTMLGSPTNWDTTIQFIEGVLKTRWGRGAESGRERQLGYKTKINL